MADGADRSLQTYAGARPYRLYNTNNRQSHPKYPIFMRYATSDSTEKRLIFRTTAIIHQPPANSIGMSNTALTAYAAADTRRPRPAGRVRRG